MKPEFTDALSTLNLVRQQLILAQVRIMELEDIRDELTPRVAETTKLLAQAQLLADEKIDASAHLTAINASLQTALQDLQHNQRLAHEAFALSQAEFTRVTERLAALTSELAARDERITERDVTMRRLKTSRSWRWTQPLRAIERWWGRRGTS